MKNNLKYNLFFKFFFFYCFLWLLFLFGPHEYNLNVSFISSIYLFIAHLVLFIAFFLGLHKKVDIRQPEICKITNDIIMLLVYFIFIFTFFNTLLIAYDAIVNPNFCMVACRENIDLDKTRTFLSGLEELFPQFSLAALLILSHKNNKYQSSFTTKILFFNIFIQIVSDLLDGNRQFVVLVIFALFFAKSLSNNSKEIIDKYKPFLIPSISFVLIAFIWLRLNISVGDSSVLTSRQVNFYSGDVYVKDFYYQYINYLFVQALLNISFYITHSFAFFQILFENFNSDVQYGFFTFRVLVIPFGASFYLQAVYSQEFVGFYPGFVWGFVLDFGPFLALFFVFMFGFIMGAIINSESENSFLFTSLSPLLKTSLLFSPIYYWFWGGLDFVILFIVLFFIMNIFLRSVNV